MSGPVAAAAAGTGGDVPSVDPGPSRALSGAGEAPGGTATRPLAPVVLDVRDVHTYFYTYDGVVRALDGVSFKLRRGETLGLVGETGCGKSVTAFTITRLVAEPPGRVVSGKILFRGANLLWGLEREASYVPVPGTKRVRVRRRFRRIKSSLQRMTAVRGSGIAMVFQEPSQAMNPVFSVGDQLGEVLYLHRGVEIVDTLLAADAAGRELDAALSQLAAATSRGDPVEVGAAARRVNELAPPPSPRGDPRPGDARDPPREEPTVRLVRDPAGRPRLGWHQEALEELMDVSARGEPIATRAAARRVADAVHLPSLEPELFAAATAERLRGPEGLRRLWHHLERARLTRVQRAFLLRERQRLALERELRRTYLDELREERPLHARRRRVRSAHAATQLRRAPFRVWGVRRRVDRPVRDELFWRAVGQLELVQIANPSTVVRGYPHELSGGMLQRVMIAMTLSIDPHVLLADEPTTALDVTIQAQILELMRSLKERVGTAIVLITHDLAVIAEVADRVCVMYAGQIVESAPVGQLFASPLHPYTQGLLASIPRLDRPDKTLASIPGSVPDLIDPPTGCRFHPRCVHAMPVCSERRPPMTEEGERHQVACFLYHGPEARD